MILEGSLFINFQKHVKQQAYASDFVKRLLIPNIYCQLALSTWMKGDLVTELWEIFTFLLCTIGHLPNF